VGGGAIADAALAVASPAQDAATCVQRAGEVFACGHGTNAGCEASDLLGFVGGDGAVACAELAVVVVAPAHQTSAWGDCACVGVAGGEEGGVGAAGAVVSSAASPGVADREWVGGGVGGASAITGCEGDGCGGCGEDGEGGVGGEQEVRSRAARFCHGWSIVHWGWGVKCVVERRFRVDAIGSADY